MAGIRWAKEGGKETIECFNEDGASSTLIFSNERRFATVKAALDLLAPDTAYVFENNTNQSTKGDFIHWYDDVSDEEIKSLLEQAQNK